MKAVGTYRGFELGPIRPPSEAGSLLIRVTRNCPWNKCTFCSLYKGETFSIRPVSHVIQDIETVNHYVEMIQEIRRNPHGQSPLHALRKEVPEEEWMAFHAALTWVRGGMTSVFLQDANSLAMKPERLVEILQHLRQAFPGIERITSYARSRTIARISDEEMAGIGEAGLNRIHIGMESGSDTVLEFVKKGVNKKTHILAGKKVKGADIELSEYFMPGLGGEEHSREHALESADALNQIDPDFIRIRTLAVPHTLELFRDIESGAFTKMGDVQMAEELLLFLESLNGITSRVKSDHILNLFQEAEGRLPADREAMTAPVRRFLAMGPDDQVIYIIGRRTGIFSRLEQMDHPALREQAEITRAAHEITLENVDAFTSQMMMRFI